MLCLMDVSGSMDERKKDLAKRFFVLLYLFLERKYGGVDVVFIRHTEQAEEVDEQRFFNDPQTGGTLVRPALELTNRVIDNRYGGPDWNVYVAQASDGDCTSEDGRLSAAFVKDVMLPKVRYFAYVDIPSSSGWFNRPSDLWQSYDAIEDQAALLGGSEERQRSANVPPLVAGRGPRLDWARRRRSVVERVRARSSVPTSRLTPECTRFS